MKKTESTVFKNLCEILSFALPIIGVVCLIFAMITISPAEKERIFTYKKTNDGYEFNCVMELNYKDLIDLNNKLFIDKNKTKLITTKECYNENEELYLDINYNLVKLNINKIKNNNNNKELFISGKHLKDLSCTDIKTINGDDIFRLKDNLIVSEYQPNLFKGDFIKEPYSGEDCLMVLTHKELIVDNKKKKMTIYTPIY